MNKKFTFFDPTRTALWVPLRTTSKFMSGLNAFGSGSVRTNFKGKSIRRKCFWRRRRILTAAAKVVDLLNYPLSDKLQFTVLCKHVLRP